MPFTTFWITEYPGSVCWFLLNVSERGRQGQLGTKHFEHVSLHIGQVARQSELQHNRHIWHDSSTSAFVKTVKNLSSVEIFCSLLNSTCSLVRRLNTESHLKQMLDLYPVSWSNPLPAITLFKKMELYREEAWIASVTLPFIVNLGPPLSRRTADQLLAL